MNQRKFETLATNKQAATLVGRKIARVVVVENEGTDEAVEDAFIVLDDDTVLSFAVTDHGSGTYTVAIETNHPYFMQKASAS